MGRPRIPTSLSAASDLQERAVEEFKMITEGEANVRKIAGVGLGVVTAVTFATSGLHDYASLSAGVFGAVSTFRTGAEYQ